MVFPTKPNSKQGGIFLINLASEVPPVVDNLGLILVIFHSTLLLYHNLVFYHKQTKTKQKKEKKTFSFLYSP